MKKVLWNYGGTILFYIVIFWGIVLVSNRITNITREGGDAFLVTVNS